MVMQRPVAIRCSSAEHVAVMSMCMVSNIHTTDRLYARIVDAS